MDGKTKISSAEDFLKAAGIPLSPKLVASELTDEEIAQLRFTTVSDEEAEEISAELERRRQLKEKE